MMFWDRRNDSRKIPTGCRISNIIPSIEVCAVVMWCDVVLCCVVLCDVVHFHIETDCDVCDVRREARLHIIIIID